MKKIAIVDDVKNARSMLARLLQDYPELEVIGDFSNGKDFLEFIKTNSVDLVFLDIEMPGIDGLAVAKLLAKTHKELFFAFATAFSRYSLEAWGTNAIGYITKPYDKAELQKVVERFLELSPVEKKIRVECFPNFNIFINNAPLVFKSKKAKEILAYLVYNKGGWVRINEICAEVLEDLDEKNAKDSFRSYMSRLIKTLEANGVSNLIEKEYGKCRIHREMLDCDYYAYLEGKKNLFSGEFLKSYSWAEPAQASMQFESSYLS